MQTENTVDSCFMLPILPHKIGNVRDLWDDVSEKFGMDIDGHLKLIDIQRILVFLQTIPDKGDFMIMFTQSRNSLEKTLHDMFASDVPCSKYLTGMFRDIAGVDLSKKENLPKLELLGDWRDTREYLEEKKMLQMPWCYATPIRQGKTEDAVRFFKDQSDVEDMLRHHDIIRRIVYLQRAPQGDSILVHLMASNPLDELLMAMTSCGSDVCNYMKRGVMDYSGIDLSSQKNVPHVELLFKWDTEGGFETAEQTIAYTE